MELNERVAALETRVEEHDKKLDNLERTDDDDGSNKRIYRKKTVLKSA